MSTKPHIHIETINEDEQTLCQSRIYLCEQVGNKARKNAASAFYYPASLVDAEEPSETPLLFTENELVRAAKRAVKNQEDIDSINFVSFSQADKDAIGREYIQSAFEKVSWLLIFSMILNKLVGRSNNLQIDISETKDEKELTKGPGI